MAFDIEMIKRVYANMPSRIEAARQLLNKPLTLTEKILELNHAYLVIIFTGISTQLLTSFTVDINLLFFLF